MVAACAVIACVRAGRGLHVSGVASVLCSRRCCIGILIRVGVLLGEKSRIRAQLVLLETQECLNSLQAWKRGRKEGCMMRDGEESRGKETTWGGKEQIVMG